MEASSVSGMLAESPRNCGAARREDADGKGIKPGKNCDMALAWTREREETYPCRPARTQARRGGSGSFRRVFSLGYSAFR